jgi:voltage-gated potassium channel
MAVSAARAAYQILEGGESRGAVAFQSFIMVLISLNVLFVIVETEEWVRVQYGSYLAWFEVVSLYIFTGEYALRLALYRLRGDRRRFALARFVVSPMMLVDLAVIVPFFLPFLVADTRVIRILRLLRLFAIFKFARMNDSMAEFGGVIKARASDLMLSFFVLFLVLILASSMMYYAERDAQPEVFSSIPASMWWGVVTLTTIGYGDTVPVTPLGRAIGAGVAILRIAVYAVPAGIMATAFNEYRRRGRGGDSCPHCGRSMER